MSAITKFFWTVIGLCSFGYIAFFAVTNDGIVAVTMLPQSEPLSAPLWLVMLIGFSSGILLISIVASVRISALRLKLYRLEKRSQNAEAKLAEQAENMPEHVSGNEPNKGPSKGKVELLK